MQFKTALILRQRHRAADASIFPYFADALAEIEIDSEKSPPSNIIFAALIISSRDAAGPSSKRLGVLCPYLAVARHRFIVKAQSRQVGTE